MSLFAPALHVSVVCSFPPGFESLLFYININLLVFGDKIYGAHFVCNFLKSAGVEIVFVVVVSFHCFFVHHSI